MYGRLRELREDHDLIQQAVADELGCSQRTVSNYELGKIDLPTAYLIKLARLYHTSTDYILGLTNKREPYPED